MLRIATRGSALARWQAERVGALLRRAGRVRGRHDHRRPRPTFRSARDRRHRRVREGGAAGRARRARRPRGALGQGPARPTTPAGLVLAAVPERGDPRDALVGVDARRDPDRRAHRAPAPCAGARSSRPPRPDLVFAPLRGNIETRLRKRADEGHDAVVVAVAALDRLGLRDQVDRGARPAVLLPQAAQGALAVECRADDARRAARLAAIDDRAAHARRFGPSARISPSSAAAARCRVARSRRVDARPARSCSTRCSPRSTVTSCCARAVAGSDPIEVGAAAARDLLDAKGGRAVLDVDRAVRAGSMTVYLVGAGPGDPGLLTRRGEELLRRADVVVYDRLASPALLDLAPAGAELVDVGQGARAASRWRRSRSTSCSSTRGAAGPRRRAAQGRRPVRVRPRRRGGRGVPRRRRPVRGRARRHERDRRARVRRASR